MAITADQLKAVVESAEAADPAQQDAIRDVLGPPTQRVTDVIYIVLIAVIGVLLIGSGWFIASYLASGHPTDVLVTIFTTSLSFLGGLLIRSPVGGTSQG